MLIQLDKLHVVAVHHVVYLKVTIVSGYLI